MSTRRMLQQALQRTLQRTLPLVFGAAMILAHGAFLDFLFDYAHQGKQKNQKGQYDQAAQAYTKAKLKDPEDTSTLDFNQGAALYKKGDYEEGLRASAILAAECLSLAEKFDPVDPSVFNQDWRSAMMPLWKPQTTEKEAVDLAVAQVKEFVKISPRRNSENAFIREPSSAAWIVSLCPDAEVVGPFVPAIERVLRQCDYSGLYYSTFFWVESAWWRLKEAGF